jgi:hypothetical protein
MIYVTDDGKKIYTTNISSGTVSILVDTLIKPEQLHRPTPGHVKTGPKQLSRLAGVLKDSTCHQMAVNYGLHQLRTE